MSVSNRRRADNGRPTDFCVYRGCFNGRYTTNSRLFRFPAKDDPRLPIWIKNSGNKRLDILAPSSIRSMGLCEKHFHQSFLVGYRLAREAIPKPFEKIHFELKKLEPSIDEKIDKSIATIEERTSPPIEVPSTESSRLLESYLKKRDEHSSEQISTVSTSGTEISTYSLLFAESHPMISEKSSDRQNSSVSTSGTNVLTSPFLFVATNSAMIDDKSDGPQNSTISTSATNVPTLSTGSSPATRDASENIREYKKVAVVFSKSDEKRCTLMKFTPPKLSTASTRGAPTVESLQKWSNYLQKEIDRLKESNKTLQRQNMSYRQTIQTLRRKEKRITVKNEILTIKAKKETVDEFLDRQKCDEPEARAMIKLQLHRRKAPYSEEEKKFAKNLYSYSNEAYASLRYAGCSLPGDSTVRGWLYGIDALE